MSFPHIEEAAVLSTCNRMELYVVALSWHRVRLTCRPVSALLQTPVCPGKGTTRNREVLSHCPFRVAGSAGGGGVDVAV